MPPSGIARIAESARAPYTDGRVVRTRRSNRSGTRVRAPAKSNDRTTTLSCRVAVIPPARVVVPSGTSGLSAADADTGGIGGVGVGAVGATTGVGLGVGAATESFVAFAIATGCRAETRDATCRVVVCRRRVTAPMVPTEPSTRRTADSALPRNINRRRRAFAISRAS